jgi:cytidylate kinase
MNPCNTPVLISGNIGSGKSTLAKKLSKEYKREYFSASHLLHEMVLEKLPKQKTREVHNGFWETSIGEKGTKLRFSHSNIDKQVDKQLLKLINQNKHCVSDARLMPFLYSKKAVRIWLKISEKEIFKRVSERDKMPISKVRKKILERMNGDKKLWKKLYQINFGEELEVFDLVLNTENLSIAQTHKIAKEFIDSQLKKTSI